MNILSKQIIDVKHNYKNIFFDDIEVIFNIFWSQDYHQRQVNLNLKGLAYEDLTESIKHRQLHKLNELIRIVQYIKDPTVGEFSESSVYRDFIKKSHLIFGDINNPIPPNQKKKLLETFFKEHGADYLYAKCFHKNKYHYKARCLLKIIEEFIIHIEAEREGKEIVTSSRYESGKFIENKIKVSRNKLISTYTVHKFKEDKQKARDKGLLYYTHGGRGTCHYMSSFTYSHLKKEYGEMKRGLYIYNTKKNIITNKLLAECFNVENYKSRFMDKLLKPYEICSWVIKNIFKQRKFIGSKGSIMMMIQSRIAKYKSNLDQYNKFINNLETDDAKAMCLGVMVKYNIIPMLRKVLMYSIAKKMNFAKKALCLENCLTTSTYLAKQKDISFSRDTIVINIKNLLRFNIQDMFDKIKQFYFTDAQYNLNRAINLVAFLPPPLAQEAA